MTGVSEIAAAYERSQRELGNFGVDADLNVGAMKQVWEGMAATLFLSAIRSRIDVIKEAAGRFGEAATVLLALDGATAAAKQQIADGEQAMRDEAARNPFAAYNNDQYQNQGGWNPYGGIGLPSFGQTAVAGGQSALARAYEEAAAKLTSLAMTSPTQERAAEKYFEKEMKKKGAPADVKIRDGEIKGFVPKWDTHPPWYRPDKSVTAIKAGVRSLQVLPGGPEALAEMHEKFGGGVRGFIDPTYMYQDSFLHAAEGHPFRATLQFVNGTLTIVGVGTLAKAAGKGAMKVGSKIGLRAGARQAAKETPALIPKPKPLPMPKTATPGASAIARPAAIEATERIGYSSEAVKSAYQGMNKGGGHAIRHLMDNPPGLIPNAGSLASRVKLFEDLTAPILRNPSKTFDWTTGGTATRAFVGEVGGEQVVLFVAKEGPYRGRVLTAYAPDAKQMAQWGLS